MLFNWEAIKARADAHCQNFSGKDIMPKTTQPFFKSSYELPLTLWSFFWKSDFRLLFNWETIEIRADTCQNCLSDKDIMLKTTQPFFKSYYDLHLTLWSFFLDVRIKAAFLSRNHRPWRATPIKSQPENFLSYLSKVTLYMRLSAI